MKQEFTTTKGKVIKERDVLFFKTLSQGFSNTLLYEIGYPFFILIGFLLQFYRPAGEEFFYYVRIVFWGLLLAEQTPRLYDIIWKRSFSNRIPLNRIASFSIVPDKAGLETYVFMNLKNGRYRKLKFRTLEKQYEPFTELLSQNIVQPQIA